VLIHSEFIGIRAIYITFQSKSRTPILVGLPRDTRVALVTLGRLEPAILSAFRRYHRSDSANVGDKIREDLIFNLLDHWSWASNLQVL
jgi:hypothetical protein